MALNFNTINSYLALPEGLYTRTTPEKSTDPTVKLWNEELALSLGFSPTEEEKKGVFSGNEIALNSTPIAQAYAGHQFGHFNVLGDGRAILLGEQLTQQSKRVDVQLKGSGRTVYSRRGDGRATLYSMLREYLISEAMYALKIPTSRSLCVLSSGDSVVRESIQPGGILTRIASSHIRVGTFEFVYRTQGKQALEKLADYAIERHYPALKTGSSDKENLYFRFFKQVMLQQIKTVVHWLRVGFIHGVMNTDNITISGETIDYGPCAFMNKYDPRTVFSSIDTQGRYAFGNQGRILLWNLARLAECLLPLFNSDSDQALEMGQKAIDSYEGLYRTEYESMMFKKIGLNIEPSDVTKEEIVLVQSFLNWMESSQSDYTMTFINLEHELQASNLTRSFDRDSLSATSLAELDQLLEQWKLRIGSNKKAAVELMQVTNPRIIPRNHQVETALNKAAKEDCYQVFHQLLNAFKNPYDIISRDHELQDPPQQGDQGYQTFCGT